MPRLSIPPNASSPAAAASGAVPPSVAQLTAILRRRVVERVYRERVPTELELMQEFGASRYSVRIALQALVTAGLVSRRRARGTVVNKDGDARKVWGVGSIQDLIGERLHRTTATLNARFVRAGRYPRAMAALSVNRGARLFRIERLLSSAEGPHSFSAFFLRAELGEQLTRKDLERDSLLIALEHRCHVSPYKIRQLTTAEPAPATIARRLDLERAGLPILVHHRTYLTDEHYAIGFAELYARTDRHQFVLDLYWSPGNANSHTVAN